MIKQLEYNARLADGMLFDKQKVLSN